LTTPLLVTQAILDLLRAGQTAVTWQNQHNTTQLDWDDLTIRAIVLGLAPQLYHRLSQWDIHLPPRAKAKLAVTYQAQAGGSA
jgi:hypothetical protein